MPTRRPCSYLLGHTDPRQWVAECGNCAAVLVRSDLQALWDERPDGSPAPGPCVHLGDATGDVRECQTCAGRVRLKVMACAVHGTCVPGRPVAGLAFCGACPDRDPR